MVCLPRRRRLLDQPVEERRGAARAARARRRIRVVHRRTQACAAGRRTTIPVPLLYAAEQREAFKVDVVSQAKVVAVRLEDRKVFVANALEEPDNSSPRPRIGKNSSDPISERQLIDLDAQLRLLAQPRHVSRDCVADPTDLECRRGRGRGPELCARGPPRWRSSSKIGERRYCRARPIDRRPGCCPPSGTHRRFPTRPASTWRSLAWCCSSLTQARSCEEVTGSRFDRATTRCRRRATTASLRPTAILPIELVLVAERSTSHTVIPAADSDPLAARRRGEDRDRQLRHRSLAAPGSADRSTHVLDLCVLWRPHDWTGADGDGDRANVAEARRVIGSYKCLLLQGSLSEYELRAWTSYDSHVHQAAQRLYFHDEAEALALLRRCSSTTRSARFARCSTTSMGLMDRLCARVRGRTRRAADRPRPDRRRARAVGACRQRPAARGPARAVRARAARDRGVHQRRRGHPRGAAVRLVLERRGRGRRRVRRDCAKWSRRRVHRDGVKWSRRWW